MGKQKSSESYVGLWDNVQTFSKIFCDGCKTESTIDGDEIDSLEYFFAEGWRKGRTKIYCPACASSKLKKK